MSAILGEKQRDETPAKDVYESNQEEAVENAVKNPAKSLRQPIKTYKVSKHVQLGNGQSRHPAQGSNVYSVLCHFSVTWKKKIEDSLKNSKTTLVPKTRPKSYSLDANYVSVLKNENAIRGM